MKNQTGYCETTGSERFMMTNVQMGPVFKGHAAQKERLPPEGDSHAAPWTGFAGSLPTPLTNSLLRSKWSKESLNDYPPEYNSIKSTGTKRETSFDTGHLCKKCISHFNVFKREALKQIIDGNLSTKDPKVFIHLYESMKPPASTVDAWGNVDGYCGVCYTHFSQLKQEAIRTILTQDRAIWAPPTTANFPSTSLNLGSQTLPRTSSHRSVVSDPHQRPSNAAPDCWIKGHQHLEALWPLSSCKGNNLMSQKSSQSPLHAGKVNEKENVTSRALCNYGATQPTRSSSMSSLLPAGTNAALSFFVRAAQKLNVMVRRARHFSESSASQRMTNFSSLLQKSPPPTPASIFQAASKSKENPGMGKVKVMLRVCSVPMSDPSQSYSFKLDLHKKQITVLNQRLTAGTTVSSKTFTFDAAFGPDSTQADVCENSLCEVLQSVLAGADGCILSFGQTNVGMSYTMIGHDSSTQSLGVIPCAISWLFKLINRKKDKTWANISVSVSAVEVCGENNAIRDLLSDVDTGNCKMNYKPDAYFREDSVYEAQLSNHSVLNAPTPERAAFLLDAALASRSGMVDSGGRPPHCCHMFFTLYVRQQDIGSSTKYGMNVDQSKLSLIDLGSCVGEREESNCGVCLAELGNFITANLNRHNNAPNRGSRLAMLLQDSLNNVNCSTTIIAHISTLSEDLTESLCTMQTVTRMRSQKKKIRKSSSSSPGGRSLGNERKFNNSTKLRFQSTGTLDQDLSSPGFSSDPAFYPGSDKSCDTISSVDPSGLVDKEVTNRSREILPIIPSLLKSKLESKKLSLMKFCEISPPVANRIKQISKEKAKEESTPTILQDESNFECLKCNTFAELQNRLGNIDGTELDQCKDQEVNTMSKSPHLSQTEKQSNSLDIQASNNRDSNSTRQGNSSKTFVIIHNSEEIPSTANCPPQLDVVKPIDPMLSSQSPGKSKLYNKIMNVMPTALSLKLEDQSKMRLLDDSTVQSETRISPIGKSWQRSTSSSSFSSSLSSSLSSPPAVSAFLNGDITHCTGKKQREMRATITVTVQKPLDLNGDDELVYTVVEEVTINGATEQGKAQILSIHESHSLQALTPGNQSVRIIGSIGEEQTANYYSSNSNAQTSENEVSTASSDAAVKHTKINAHIDKVSDFTDLKNLPQHDTWSEVPLTEDVKEIPKGAIVKLDPPCEVSKSRKYACEIKPEQSWMCLNSKKDVKDVPHMKTEQKNQHNPRETYEKKQYTKTDSLVEWTKDNMPSTSTNGPNLKRKETKEESGIAGCAMLNLATETKTNTKSHFEESSKLFNVKLKALSGRSQTWDHSKSRRSTGSLEGNSSSRLKSKFLEETAFIDMAPKGLLDEDYISGQASPLGFKEDFEDFVRCRASQSLGRVPQFFPMHDANDATRPSENGHSKSTSVNKFMPSSKIHKIPILSPKPTRHSINRSSSFSPNGAPVSQSCWSTLSLSRSQDNSGLKSPGAVRKGRAELLRSSRDSLSAFSQGGSDLDECEELGTMKPFVHALPSPYSRITAPRTPHHCSGHASDTTSVLSGELPPAMCKTALLYNRSSMVSSGYDSMLRDSEATISSSSTHNSISDQSCSLGAAKGMRSTKKRTNIGSSLRRPSQENLLSLKRSVSGPKTHRVDRGGSDSYEIKVYEIDNVDGVQKRGGAGNKGIVLFSAKLKFLEHRQQRIAEVRLKYNALRRELEHTKHHLMLDPGKWTRKFDLWQTFEVDSLEHLEALEQVTQRLERHVNLCKAHVLMVTSFDVTPKCRQKLRHRPTVDHAAFVGI
ncbi:kinesin-like protein KIF26B isoform X2 [Cyprinus carpio]|uniref:Kinesin-like protein KIF26B isoform X2 n=1 Tax=Cyprinus carpio TaxID=7962 RepID=A0A9R0BGM7_CYPCA|nr:kinesin-like protein KIF26B isoform X2 [Cyprinus carpio]